jgi:hypothetical protein
LFNLEKLKLSFLSAAVGVLANSHQFDLAEVSFHPLLVFPQKSGTGERRKSAVLYQQNELKETQSLKGN